MASLNSVVGALRANLTLNTAAFHKGAKAAQTDMKGLVSYFKSAGPALAATAKTIAVAFAAAVGAVSAGTVVLANNAKEIQRSSKQLGMTADSYQVLTKASQKYGIEADKMKDILKDLNDRMGDYLQTGAGPLKDFMENVAKPQGVNVQDLMKLPPEDQLLKIQSLMESAGLSLAEQTFHMESLASDATRLIPMLERGGAELDKIRNSLYQTGQILSDDVIKNLTIFSSNLSMIGNTISGWGNLLVSGFSDELADISNRVTNFVTQSQGIRTFFVDMGNVIGSTLTGMVAAYDAVIAKINQIVDGNSRFSSTFQSIVTLGQYAFQALTPPVQILWESLKLVWEIVKNVGNAFSVVADVALYALAAILPEVQNVTGSLNNGLVSAIRTAVDAFATIAEESRYAFQMAGAYAKGGVDAIQSAFSLLPAALGDLMMQATNSVLSAVEAMVNGVISRINGAIQAMKSGLATLANRPEFLGGDGGKSKAMMNGPQLPSISPIEIGKVKNAYEGAASKLGKSIDESFSRHVDPVINRRIQDRILEDAPALNLGFPALTNPTIDTTVTPTAPYIAPPTSGGGSKGGKGGGGGKPKLTDEAKEAQREAKKEADAYKNLQERLTELREGFGQTALQKQILTEQMKIGNAASHESVAAMVTEIDKIQKWEDAMDQARNTFVDGFAAIVTGAKSAKEVVLDVLADMANKMAQTAASSFFDKYIAPAVTNWIGGPSAGGPDALSSALHTAGAPVPGFANGVTNFAGGLAMVGERGPELVSLGRHSSVIPHHQTARMMDSSASAIRMEVILSPDLETRILDKSNKNSIHITEKRLSNFKGAELNGAIRRFNSDPRAIGG